MNNFTYIFSILFLLCVTPCSNTQTSQKSDLAGINTPLQTKASTRHVPVELWKFKFGRNPSKHFPVKLRKNSADIEYTTPWHNSNTATDCRNFGRDDGAHVNFRRPLSKAFRKYIMIYSPVEGIVSFPPGSILHARQGAACRYTTDANGRRFPSMNIVVGDFASRNVSGTVYKFNFLIAIEPGNPANKITQGAVCNEIKLKVGAGDLVTPGKLIAKIPLHEMPDPAVDKRPHIHMHMSAYLIGINSTYNLVATTRPDEPVRNFCPNIFVKRIARNFRARLLQRPRKCSAWNPTLPLEQALCFQPETDLTQLDRLVDSDPVHPPNAAP